MAAALEEALEEVEKVEELAEVMEKDCCESVAPLQWLVCEDLWAKENEDLQG